MPFSKGQSGNPRGRPRVVYDVRELARQRSPEALETLTEIMQNPKAPPAARVAAASQVINRGYGLPTQTIEQATITKRAEEYTDDELATIIAQAQGVPVKPAAEQEDQRTTTSSWNGGDDNTAH